MLLMKRYIYKHPKVLPAIESKRTITRNVLFENGPSPIGGNNETMRHPNQRPRHPESMPLAPRWANYDVSLFRSPLHQTYPLHKDMLISRSTDRLTCDKRKDNRTQQTNAFVLCRGNYFVFHRRKHPQGTNHWYGTCNDGRLPVYERGRK